MQDILNIQFLGDFQLKFGDSQITALNADRPQSLFAYLVLHRRAPQPRHHVAFTLWPDSSEAQAFSNLRNLLHRIRRALPCPDAFISVDKLTLQWKDDAPFVLDVVQFEEALERAKSADLEGARCWLTKALRLYGGDLLPGNYDDWLIPLREDLRQQYAEALVQLIDLLEAARDFRSAVQYAQKLVRLDPLNETGYVRQMKLHALNGDRAAVRQTFEQCVAVLRRELSADPDPATQAAYHEYVQLHAPDSVVPNRVQQTLQPKPLPLHAGPFLGREKELSKLSKVLTDRSCHLLTLVGPGGMGKTQLALHLARQNAAAFVDGVAFVPLVGITEFEQVVLALAEAFDLTLQDSGDYVDLIVDQLAGRQILVIFDNMEQLVEEADKLANLLTKLPACTALVTSRERLHLYEEWVHEVQGLLLPTDPKVPLEENAATALFLHFAQRTRHGFTPADEDVAAIQRICALVDGMPLGIELAASWVHVLSCREIATEIEHNLDFLATAARNVPERHRTLLSLFEYSWQLLTDCERKAFRRLSLFRVGFDRMEAEQIANVNLDLLSALADKSLLYRNAEGRYEMHERVRQYAYRKLHEAQEATEMRDRFLIVYLVHAEAAHEQLFGVREAATVLELENRYLNIRTALEWALVDNDYEARAGGATSSVNEKAIPERLLAGLKLTAALARYWYLSGRFHEGREWLQKALILIEPWSADQQVNVLGIHARLLFGAGDLTGAFAGYSEAMDFLHDGLALYRALEDLHGITITLERMAELSIGQGKLTEAEQWAQESLAIATRLNNPWLKARAMAILSVLAIEHGRRDQAWSLATEALDLFRSLQNSGSVAYLLNILGQLAVEENQVAKAVALLQEALHLVRSQPKPNLDGEAWTLRNLGLAAQKQKDYAQAVDCFRQSLLLRQQLGQLSGVAWSIEGLAEVAAETGDWIRSARLWGAATYIRAQEGSHASYLDRTRVESLLESIHNQLGRQQFEAICTQGQVMSLSDSIQYALNGY